MSGKLILIVEDEHAIRQMIAFGLRRAGFDVREAADCREARQSLADQRPDLMLVDWMLPDMSGLELTRAVKRDRQTRELPIIMLTARAEEGDKVTGLENGADDYITKPFAIQELLARVRVQLRRVAEREAESDYPRPVIAVGDFEINTERHQVRVRGEEVRLTPKEFDLLLLFTRNPERVLTHKALQKAIWGPAGIDQTEGLRVLVGQLRRKIERGKGGAQLRVEGLR